MPAIRSVPSRPSTRAVVVSTPSMYAGACTTMPTIETSASVNRKGASSIPRNRDFAFILDQLEVPGHLVDEFVRPRADAEARDGPGRQLRETRVLDEGRGQADPASPHLEGVEVLESRHPHDDLLLTLSDPRAEPAAVLRLRLERRDHRGVGDLNGELPAGQGEVRAHSDDELVVHRPASVQLRGALLLELPELLLERLEPCAGLVPRPFVVGLRVRGLEPHPAFRIPDLPTEAFPLRRELEEPEPDLVVAVLRGEQVPRRGGRHAREGRVRAGEPGVGASPPADRE